MTRKNRKPNPVHDVTGCCRWPQQEAKYLRQRQRPKPEDTVKFVQEFPPPPPTEEAKPDEVPPGS